MEEILLQVDTSKFNRYGFILADTALRAKDLDEAEAEFQAGSRKSYE